MIMTMTWEVIGIKAKLCPICKIGKPRLIHYAVPMKYNFDCWEETDEGIFEPIITYKRVECSNCGAACIGVQIKIDDAIRDWNYMARNNNRSMVLQFIQDESLEVDTDGQN